MRAPRIDRCDLFLLSLKPPFDCTKYTWHSVSPPDLVGSTRKLHTPGSSTAGTQSGPGRQLHGPGRDAGHGQAGNSIPVLLAYFLLPVSEGRDWHMKAIQIPLLLGILAMPATCGAQAVPQAPEELDQDPVASADRLALRIREHAAAAASGPRTIGLVALAEEARSLASGLDPTSPLWRRLQADRLYALFLAGRHPDVVAAYRTMQRHHAQAPSYVIAGIAESLAKSGHIAEAGQLLQGAATASPGDSAPAIRYAYLLVDQGRYDDAIGYLEQWLAAARQRDPGGNPAIAEAQLVLARVQRWDERFDEAEHTLAAVDAVGADATALAAERAILLRQRARPRAAIALLQKPVDQDARQTLALAWMDLGRPDLALAALGAEGNTALRNRIGGSLHGRGLVSARYGESRSAAIASPNGAQESRISVLADGPWLGGGWRIGARAADHRAEFQGGMPVARYAGVRLVLATTGGETVFEAGRSFDDFLPQGYASVETSAWISDRLRLGGQLAINDPLSSLQARASGIGSDTAGVSATYRNGERWRIDAGASGARFDDGNRRWSATFSGEVRLRADAHSITSAFAGAYVSRSSLEDAPYFNPGHDASFESGVVHGFRGFAGSWQAWRPSVAHYWQDGFGSALIPRLGYSIRFGSGAGRWWQLDIGAGRPVYDGQRETQWSIALNHGWGG